MIDKIIQEVTPDSLLDASYEHFGAYVLHCGHTPGDEFHNTPQLAWGFSGPMMASKLGYPVYLGLGFQERCQMPLYLWHPPEGQS